MITLVKYASHVLFAFTKLFDIVGSLSICLRRPTLNISGSEEIKAVAVANISID